MIFFRSFLILNFLPYMYTLPDLSWNSKWNPVCHWQECCTDKWINFDRNNLANNIREKVYGQPLVKRIVKILSAHLNSLSPPKKALVLSFHGGSGTGKNYVAQFIAESMYVKGFDSTYVHYFNGPTWEDHQLYSQIKDALLQCPRSLFIFDQVDKTSPELLNSIKPLIDIPNPADGVDSSKAVFIFLSKTGTDLIYKRYSDGISQGGRSRNDFTVQEFEKIIREGGFHEAGGFHLSETTKNNLIDHYIPFLPLEVKHVRPCVINRFKIEKVPNPKVTHINEVMNYLKWDKTTDLITSKSGCKKVALKVEFLVAEHYWHLLDIHKEL